MIDCPPPTPSSADLNWSKKAFGDSIEWLQTCCARACEAARVGRYIIADEWFRNALIFFNHARSLNCDEVNQANQADEMYLWLNTWQLMWARRQLDRCAALLYFEELVLEGGSWGLLTEGGTA